MCVHAGPQVLRGAGRWASKVGRSHVHDNPWSQGSAAGTTSAKQLKALLSHQLPVSPPLDHCPLWALPSPSGHPCPSHHSARRISPAKGTDCNISFPSHLESTSKVIADRLFSILQLAQMTCQLLEASLKHEIKTLLLSPPPTPENKHTHTHKSHQGSKRQTVKGSLSLLRGLCDRRVLPGLFALSKNRVAQLCWPQSMKDARRRVSRQDCAGRCGEEPETSQGHTALHPPVLPACCFSSGWLSGSLSLCPLSLCFYVCSEGAIGSARPAGGNGSCSPHSLRLTGIGS